MGLGLSLALAVCLIGTHVFAATPKPRSFDANAVSGIEISPAIAELKADPGMSYVVKIRVHNVTSNELVYTASVNDFASKDETGSPKPLPIGELPPTASIIGWVSKVDDFRLKSQETKTLNVTITVPKNAESGGHYGMINFGSKDPQALNNGIGVKVTTGLLVLIQVPGAIDEDVKLATLTTEQDGKTRPIFENTPITFVTRLRNEGNIHEKPTGNITVTDVFGGIVSTLKVNENAANVLPNSTRRFESILTKDWMFGRYTANLTIGYGSKGQAITSQIVFWVIPWKIVFGVLFVVGTLGFIVWRLIKVYNRHIINKYKKHNEKYPKKSKKK